MTQARIAKMNYNMKIALPWFTYLLFFSFLTSVICFLVFTGRSANSMGKASKNNGNNNETNIYNSSDSFYRELSFQATVIALLVIITFCVVYHTFKALI